jgi:hypothetical protein
MYIKILFYYINIMDYREIFRNALDCDNKNIYNLCNKKTHPEQLNTGDIIDINNMKYLVLYKYGKFHKLLCIEEYREQLTDLKKHDFILVLSNKIKDRIKEYEKKDLTISRYVVNNYFDNQ